MTQASGQGKKWGDLHGMVEVPVTFISRELSSSAHDSLIERLREESLSEEKLP